MTDSPRDESTDAALLERALRAERAVEEVTEERNRLWIERHRSESAKAEAQYYRTVVAQIHASRSWRYTAQLRRLRAAQLSRQLPWSLFVRRRDR